jgi:hypothetical protein
MIRKYKDCWGVILPRGGGVKRFDSEKAAKQFVLACALFEDVWQEEPQLSDDARDVEAAEPEVTHAPEDETSHDAIDVHVSYAIIPQDI